MVITLAQLSGNAAAQGLVAVSGTGSRTPAKWVQFSVPLDSPNSAQILVGDSSVSSTRGTIIPKTATAPVTFFPIGDTQYINLEDIFFYGASGDKLNVTYAK